MQPTRIIVRSPHLCGRIVKAPSAARSMSLLSPFGSRLASHNFPTFANDFTPLFRLMDDMTLAAPRFEHFLQPQLRSVPTFQPRFDVREVEGAYELRGELPGVEVQDLEVHFTDAQTLVVRGKTERDTTRGTRAAVASSAESQETTMNAVVDNTDAVSTHSASSYQKATVEDENGAATETASASAPATPAESVASEQQPTAPTQNNQQVQSTNTSSTTTPQYWVAERSTGSFQRTFTFPTRVDQDAVKASLRNGVLNVVVPKAVAPTLRRIIVE